jgi:hypothetical protein
VSHNVLILQPHTQTISHRLAFSSAATFRPEGMLTIVLEYASLNVLTIPMEISPPGTV